MTQHMPDPPPPPANDPEAPGPSPLGPNVAEELMGAAAGRITALEAELAEAKDRWLRAEAESQNLARRLRAEIDSTRQYAVQKFARDIVDSAENFSRALLALPAAGEGEPEIVAKLREGLLASERGFLGVLERNGVVREDATGQPFDPEKHQAMAEMPSAEVPAGHVAQAYSPAWLLNGRLLKPAMVVVSKGPAAGQPAAQAAPPATGTEG